MTRPEWKAKVHTLRQDQISIVQYHAGGRGQTETPLNDVCEYIPHFLGLIVEIDGQRYDVEETIREAIEDPSGYWINQVKAERQKAAANLRLAAERAGAIAELQAEIRELRKLSMVSA